MTNLKQARDKGKLDEFIAEREDQPHADNEAFHSTLNAMARKPKSESETSPPDDCED